MPQFQVDCYMALTHSSKEIAKQLAIANKLKALELKLQIDKSVKAPYEWTAEIDQIIGKKG